MFYLILRLLLLPLNPNLLILTLIFSLLVFNRIIFIKLEQLLDAWAFTDGRWQISKRVTKEERVAPIMQNILAHHLRQIVLLVPPSLHIHQVFPIHILLHAIDVCTANKFDAFRDPHRFERRFKEPFSGVDLSGLGVFVGYGGAWDGHFKLGWQVMCIDEVEYDIFELGKTPADFEACVVVERGQLGYKALDTLMDLS